MRRDPPRPGRALGGGAFPDTLGWQLAAVVSWVLVLAVLGVLTTRFGPCSLGDLRRSAAAHRRRVMRVAWDRRVTGCSACSRWCFIAVRGGLSMLESRRVPAGGRPLRVRAPLDRSRDPARRGLIRHAAPLHFLAFRFRTPDSHEDSSACATHRDGIRSSPGSEDDTSF